MGRLVSSEWQISLLSIFFGHFPAMLAQLFMHTGVHPILGYFIQVHTFHLLVHNHGVWGQIFLIFSLVHAPGEVVGSPGSPVLLHQLLHHLPAVVQLVKVVLKSSDAISSKINNITNMNLEHGVFSELVNEGLPLPQFVIVSEDSFKQAGKYEMALGILFY